MNEEKEKFFYIGDVSKITGIPEHILRYWEGEFRILKPIRDQRGHRLYSEKDIEKIKNIKLLIYKEGYKIKGAKKKIKTKEDKKSKKGIVDFLNYLIKEIEGIKKCLK
ncbi:MAG TPA: MerR family transcriptional regulator [Candidatus Ratteibacteria bacterium]|nr:MerR family transcriptional regulator [bacterium]HRR95699.1 MerR family transcriptional regulator [Candidatus Ratteibacteria bacterium]